ncbi:LysR substrate-binding domain-containing protein [Acinetobacter sp. ANC 4173]|uniref:LysR substrate-binding domain-containing protein n=1 Tax=Acinetobacter sp. ANC 4173 TaxID=2529837 RepID=UPI0010398B53|nr:LysR substrate-binding domain-containing protein [Acinetobacter sp. ANC 4173]TCB80403.1 hypothetical protein E0H94_07865 [Acinetobacter sp. ANC 4173]
MLNFTYLYFDLYEENSYLYCGNQHPLFSKTHFLSLNELQNWQAIMPSYNIPSDAVHLQQRLNTKASATDREGIAFLILTGNFLGFLPDHYAKKWVSENKMMPLLESEMIYATEICLVTKKTKSNNMILEYFLNKIILS